jgi:tetratricopeptide repeat protein
MRLLPRNPWLWHAAAVAVSLWAMSALVRFRVVGWSVAAYLPWIGTVLVLLNGVLLVREFIGPSAEASTLRDLVRRVDRIARLVVVAFAYWALFVTFDAGMDRTPRVLWHGEIVDMSGRTLTAGVPLVYSWASVRTSAADGQRLQEVVLGPQEQRKFWRGEAVVLGIGGGRFGLPWITAFDRDEEVYARRLLESSPNAVQPWHDLVQFLVDHGRLAEAATEARRYLDVHPDDADFAYWIGDNLNIRGFDGAAPYFLARAVAVHPTRYNSYRLAWTLVRRGDPEPALDALTTATRRYPDAWEFPFLLGYQYARMRRFPDAIAALERVDALKPGIGDVSDSIARLCSRGPVLGR